MAHGRGNDDPLRSVNGEVENMNKTSSDSEDTSRTEPNNRPKNAASGPPNLGICLRTRY